MKDQLKIGKYKHYKGNYYEVLYLAKHSETLEDLVVYKPLYESEFKIWVRPLKMFIEKIEIDGVHVQRFSFVSVD